MTGASPVALLATSTKTNSRLNEIEDNDVVVQGHTEHRQTKRVSPEADHFMPVLVAPHYAPLLAR